MKILNNNKSNNSSTIGIQSNKDTPQALLFNKEKEEKLKRSLYMKFWMALLLTNIFTFILSMPSEPIIQEREIVINKDETILKLKINEMTNTVGKDQFIALYSGSQHITNKAKIIKELSNDDTPIYLVKIPISELNKIEPFKALELASYPVTNHPKPLGGAYEIEI